MVFFVIIFFSFLRFFLLDSGFSWWQFSYLSIMKAMNLMSRSFKVSTFLTWVKQQKLKTQFHLELFRQTNENSKRINDSTTVTGALWIRPYHRVKGDSKTQNEILVANKILPKDISTIERIITFQFALRTCRCACVEVYVATGAAIWQSNDVYALYVSDSVSECHSFVTPYDVYVLANKCELHT